MRRLKRGIDTDGSTPDLPGTARRRDAGLAWRASASSAADAVHSPDRAADDNYATAWTARADDPAPWLQADLGRERMLRQSRLRPLFPTRSIRLSLESSRDGRHWDNIAVDIQRGGSPIILRHAVSARYLRLHVTPASMLEWTIE